MCYQCLCPFIWIKFVFVFLNFGTTRKEMPKKCDCNLLCSKRPRIVFAHLRPFNNISTKHFPGNAIVFYTCTDVVVFFFTYMDPLISIDFPIRQTFGHLFETCSNKVINCLVRFLLSAKCERAAMIELWPLSPTLSNTKLTQCRNKWEWKHHFWKWLIMVR